MELYIDTTLSDGLVIRIDDNGKIVYEKKINGMLKQAELLLPAIEGALKRIKVKPDDITEIIVNNHGGSLTGLRVGISTANALGYALGIPVIGANISGKAKHTKFSLVRPIYGRKPNITKK